MNELIKVRQELMKVQATVSQLINTLDKLLADNHIDIYPQLRTQTLKLIRAAGKEGKKVSHLQSYSRLWQQATLEQRRAVLKDLVDECLIYEVKLKNKPTGRKLSPKYIAAEFI